MNKSLRVCWQPTITIITLKIGITIIYWPALKRPQNVSSLTCCATTHRASLSSFPPPTSPHQWASSVSAMQIARLNLTWKTFCTKLFFYPGCNPSYGQSRVIWWKTFLTYTRTEKAFCMMNFSGEGNGKMLIEVYHYLLFSLCLSPSVNVLPLNPLS